MAVAVATSDIKNRTSIVVEVVRMEEFWQKLSFDSTLAEVRQRMALGMRAGEPFISHGEKKSHFCLVFQPGNQTR